MKYIYLLMLLIVSVTSNAQTIEREVVSSNGNFYSNSAGQLSTTLGEPVISTVNNGTNELTQGFQQTKITVTGIEDYQTEFNMNVYPNPVSEQVTIEIKEIKEAISFSIYTTEGKLIMTSKLTELQTKLNIEGFAKGNYFLNITEQNKIIKTYKIIKQ